MRRRRVIIGSVAVALVALTAFAFWPRQPRPCRATFEHVHRGMTFEEVCATVGGPPGNYSGRPTLKEISMGGVKYTAFNWIADDGTLVAIFDRDSDGAIYIDIREPLADNRTLLQRLRDRLGL